MSQYSHIHEIQDRSSKSRGEGILGDRTDEPLFRKDTAASEITVININEAKSQGGRTSEGSSVTPVSYWITPTMVVTPHLSMNFINSTSYDYANRNINIINYSKIMKIVRMIGLMAVISYTATILFIWVYANIQGYVYFSAGKSILSIKYLEWLFGIIGIFVVIDCLRKELRDELSYNNKENINFYYEKL